MKLQELLEANKTGADPFKKKKDRADLSSSIKKTTDAKNSRKAKDDEGADDKDVDMDVTKPKTPKGMKETGKQVPGSKSKKNIDK